MNHDCDFQKFIAINYNFLQKNNIHRTTKKNKERVRTLLLLNLSVAYLNIGDNVSAGQMLSGVDYFSDNSSGAASKVVYYNNMFVYYLRINDIPSATQALEQMDAALQSSKLRKSDYDRYSTTYISKKHLVNMENGNYDGCEMHFSLMYNIESSILGKVSAKFTLGKIYLHDGKSIEAKQAFEYVINNGGTSYYVVKARDYLNQLA